MADTKITALSALTAADPANDVLPIVDVNDPFMAASGTTKKISINNILACSPTATLASATITGDLTVDTSTLKVDSANDRVIVGHTSGSSAFQVTNAGAAGFEVQPTGVNSAPAILSYNRSSPAWLQLTYGASSHVFQLSGTDGMTLNATGLSVGNASPAAALDLTNTGVTASREIRIENSAVRTFLGVEGSSGRFVGSATNNAYFGCSGAFGLEFATNNNVRMVVDTTGNVGIGVTSPTSQLTVGSGGTANPAATVAFHKSTSDEYRLKLTSSTFNAAGKWIGLGLGYSSDYMKMAIIAEAKDTNARGNLYFALNNDATSANASIADAKMTLKSTGQVRFVPLASDPSGAEAGDVYYNSTSNKLKCYNGTTWNDLF